MRVFDFSECSSVRRDIRPHWHVLYLDEFPVFVHRFIDSDYFGLGILAAKVFFCHFNFLSFYSRLIVKQIIFIYFSYNRYATHTYNMSITVSPSVVDKSGFFSKY